MKSGMKVYCVTMDKNFVVGLVSKNGDILCIDIFNTDKEDNFDTYWVDKRNLQIGWKVIDDMEAKIRLGILK